MPVDWEALERDLDGAIDKAASTTDEALVDRISSLTRMTEAEVGALFPDPAERAELVRLMRIVKSADDQNAKVNEIFSNSQRFGKIVVRLLDRFV